VKPGEAVTRGQRLASKPDGALGAHVHSSVDGEVAAVCSLYVDVEATGPSLDISPGQGAAADPGIVAAADPGIVAAAGSGIGAATGSGIGAAAGSGPIAAASPVAGSGAAGGEAYVPIGGSTVLEMIEEAGIVGCGGAGFPTAAKLARPLGPGGLLILNAAECEPTLRHNITLLESDPARAICGMLHAMRTVQAERGAIAIKEKHAKAIRSLRGVIDRSDKISIHFLEDHYPSGEERAAIRDVAGVLLRPDQLPFEAGCVVLNVETAARIADAAEHRKPVMSKDLTLAGQYCGAAFRDRNSVPLMDVPLGLPVSALIEHAGGLSQDFGELLGGGPFTGKAVLPATPVTKTMGGLAATMPFLRVNEKMGLLVCACGADQQRLMELAAAMGGEVAGIEHCKQSAQMPNGTRKCENPGHCPGQAEKVISLYRQGARALLISNCSDCTNTVMTIADRLPVKVYHSTDSLLRTAGPGLIRRKHI
jgi:proline reductase-associated electron transfer protein PrdC